MTVRAERSWSKRVPDDRKFDVIVIGSGIGGMGTAATLAKLGRKVLVLEQHYVPGGFTHTFRRKGYTWDVGVHIVGETSQRSLPGRILSDLTGGGLTWEPVGPIYDEFRFPDDVTIQFPSDGAAFADTLKSHFPHEAAGIDRYLAETRATVRSMRGHYLGLTLPGRLGRWLGGQIGKSGREAFQRTTAEVIHPMIRDERLRTVLTAQWGYHGAPPSRSSWALHALVTRHFLHGAGYPVGGASRIAETMLRTVADAGGWTRICTDVDQILVENGRAVGVKMVDGEEIRAARVVSAVGAYPTVTRLLPPALRQADWAQAATGLEPAPAHLCLYLGFKGDIASAGATRQCQWYYDTWSHEEAIWDVHPDRPVTKAPILFTSFPSLKDPAHDPGPEQRHTGEIITFVPWSAFQRWQGTPWRRRGKDYEAFKAALSQSLLDELFRQHPGLRDKLDHHELATPLSTDLFVRPYNGSIYGLMGTPHRYGQEWLRPASPVPGLYLSGSDVASCGVIGAFMGGLLCAAAMEPVRGVRYLSQVMKGR
jgi:all-trans-retinol 13,14-reductase